MIPGTQGYAEQADELVERYESIRFDEKHRGVLHLIPQRASRIVDIGAGTGADAAWLADQGHHVVAVEPTRELRRHGMERHPSPRIEWLDDSLPDLAETRRTARVFDMVLLTAVWMHLDRRERAIVMPRLAGLLGPGGLLLMSLRHGSVPPGRRMFDVPAGETVELAQAHGFREIFRLRAPSVQTFNRQAGIEWTQLALARN